MRRGRAVEDGGLRSGRSSTLASALPTGPWWEGGINVELFEAVSATAAARAVGCCSRRWSRSPTRMAAVRDFATEQLRAAAGVADRTYRRARKDLLSTGELVLVNGVGGRGNRNVWTVRTPSMRWHRGRARNAPGRSAGGREATRRRDGSVWRRPRWCRYRLVRGGKRRSRSDSSGPEPSDSDRCLPRKGRSAQTVSADNRSAVTGVLDEKGGQDRTRFELPAQERPQKGRREAPAQTPAPHARARRKDVNPRTPEDPPNPPKPKGGSRACTVST